MKPLLAFCLLCHYGVRPELLHTHYVLWFFTMKQNRRGQFPESVFLVQIGTAAAKHSKLFIRLFEHFGAHDLITNYTNDQSTSKYTQNYSNMSKFSNTNEVLFR